MIENERTVRNEEVLQIGRKMMIAARTAPKGKGFDIVEIAMVSGEQLHQLSAKMNVISEEKGLKFFLRDAENILAASCVILIGTHEKTHGLNCGYCGFANCADRSVNVPCAINTVDVGIAIGSACSVAADNRVDTRVMFSAGFAAFQLDWITGCSQVIAIAVSASSKNPFFDRQSKAPQQK